MLLSEKKLVTTSIICSVIGIAALLVIAAVAEPLQVSVSDVNKVSAKGSSNVKVRVVGFVDSVSIWENNAVIKIAAVEAVEAVSFDTSYVKSLNLKRFQEVEVSGELRQYKGKPSLIITKLRLLNDSLGCGG